MSAPTPDTAMLDAIARQLMVGAGERFEDLSAAELEEERRSVTWWIESCRAAGYDLVPITTNPPGPA